MKKPVIVSTQEWVYPDIAEYASASENITLHAARGSWAAVQIFFPETVPGEKITAKAFGMPSEPELYRMKDVLVRWNTGTSLTDAREGRVIDASAYTTRQAPFRVYDCLMPFSEGGDVTEKKETALYIAFPIARDAVPAAYAGNLTVTIGENVFEIPASITVHKATVPENGRLKMTNWTYPNIIGERYDAPYMSDEWFRLYKCFMRLLARCRSTHMLLSLSIIHITEKDGKYEFDFSDMEKFIRATIEGGIKMPELGHICSKDYNLNGPYFLFYMPEGRQIPADSEEGYNFLSQFLPEWTKFLKEHDWYDISYQHVGDEPIDSQVDNYRIICGVVRKFMPGMKLFDAVSSPLLRGAIDCWVPLNSHYQEHQAVYEGFRQKGDEIWQYTCCGPTGKWLNRMLDFELIRPRLLHYGNYLFDLAGYLHWGFAAWQKNQPDPVEDTHGIINDGVALLPAGDTHVCYPGNANGPWMSLRAEAMRMGAEDCELLWKLADSDKAAADALCKNVMTSFIDYTTDVPAFDANYVKILEAVDALEE